MGKFLDKIKQVYLSSIAEENQEVKNFTDAKTSDGLILKISDDLKLGAKVEVVNEDGSLTVPLEGLGGDLTLEDGTAITVDATGIIIGLETKAEEATEGDETMATSGDTKSAPVKNSSEVDIKMEAITSEIAELKEAIEFFASQNKEKKEIESNDEVEKLKSELEKVKAENIKLSKQPATKALTFKKSEEKEENKRKSFAEILANNKPAETK